MSSFDISKARSNFPILSTGYIFADNAGGSQVAKEVVDRITDYLLNTNVQLGADYSIAVQSTKRVLVDGPHEAMKLFNAASPDEIVFGSSSTLNLVNLARGLENDIQPGDEFIVTGEHEANVGVWKNLAVRRGAIVKFWKHRQISEENPYAVALRVEDLIPLISSKTRIVAFTACSNILGSIVPVKEVAKAVRTAAKEKGAKKVEISVDCVAYAPHRQIDVQDWDVDFCIFSFYKVYGPHISGLYVRASALQTSVSQIVHHFLKVNTVAYKLQPGGPGYETVYGSTGVVPYLLSLTPANDLKTTFDAISAHDLTLAKPLLEFLTDPVQRERGVRVVGEETASLNRAPTISFVVVGQKSLRSKDIVSFFDQKGGIGIRYGHFYAYTLVESLTPKLDPEDGVVRISLAHYNTVEEVNKIIDVLKEVFA
ncbi:pyridoxal phosphate-dependent transferase [Crucibulum laeve]|uniref:Pyridoxal phosphate-dependent transferase n=1 Tax=Crucibulum laeve TaxID=68775 RepID=A0A5C3LP44_9AGAR|nr:pyridoxal phosphate-dependent transferase [Crucibulum laeve]